MNTIYYVSLYYDNSVVTGANNRFDEIGKRLLLDPDVNLRVVIAGKNIPGWCSGEDCIVAPKFRTGFGRIFSFLWLTLFFVRARKGIIVTDFMPIPLFMDVAGHKHYQLIHDLRNFGIFARGGLGRLSSTFQKIQLKISQNVLTVSEFSANEIVKYCGVDRKKIYVSYNGINAEGGDTNSSGRNIDILYVATFESRKNHVSLVQSLGQIDAKLRVVFVGRDLGLKHRVVRLANQSQHEFEYIESLPENELVRLYKSAKVFVFPSLYEGFGMPLVEAMEYGCSLACSKLPVFEEIAEENAEYFDPNDIGSIADSIKRLLNEPNDAKLERLVKSKAQARKFEWGQIYLELMRSLGAIDKEVR